MVKRILIIIFLLTASAQAECKYYAEADVINEVLVNKKEHYTCKEHPNFFIRFLTEEEFQNAFVLLVLTIAESI
jgi:hypothetical protein